MTEIVITFLVKVEEHPFEESSGELTWDKKQIEQPIYVRSRLPKKNIIGIGLVWSTHVHETNWKYVNVYQS